MLNKLHYNNNYFPLLQNENEALRIPLSNHETRINRKHREFAEKTDLVANFHLKKTDEMAGATKKFLRGIGLQGFLIFSSSILLFLPFSSYIPFRHFTTYLLPVFIKLISSKFPSSVHRKSWQRKQRLQWVLHPHTKSCHQQQRQCV